MYPVDNAGGHWEGRPAVPIQSATGCEAEEIISILRIAGWAQSDGTGSARRHGVVMLFMSLDVGSKFELAVFGVIELHTSNDRPRADGLRVSVGWREAI
jgi:hypothetical protein